MNKQFLLYILLCIGIPSTNAQLNIDTNSYNTAIERLNFDAPNFVVIGEHHYINNTFATEFFIVSKLAEQGFKTIYIEGGNSEAAIMNLYLQTGDTNTCRYTRARALDCREFLESVYQINKQNNYGLTFIGFDFERPLSVGYLFSKWFDNTSTIELKKLGEYFCSIDRLPASSLAEVEQRGFKMKTVLDSIRQTFNENYYKEILKDNYNLFYKIVYNPIYADFKKTGLFEKRDPYFVKTMLKEEREGRLNKSIIIAGGSHVIDKGRFIATLADSLIDKYTVNCFFFVYNNCKNSEDPRPYTSPRSHLKYLDEYIYDRPVVNFNIFYRGKIIPTKNKDVINTVVGMHNQ